MPPQSNKTLRDQQSPDSPQSSEPAIVACLDSAALQLLESAPPHTNSLCPTCCCHLPTRFRGSQEHSNASGPADSESTPADVAAEPEKCFNLADVSGSNEELSIPRAHGDHYAGNLQTSATTNPPMSTHLSQQQASFAEVAFFFLKHKDNKQVFCVVCLSFSYGTKTSNMSKCGHIERFHLDIYLEKAEKNSWMIWLEPVKAVFLVGYDFWMLHQALAAPNASIQLLSPLNQGRDMSSSPLGPIAVESGHLPFSSAAFHQYLMQFIVTDNQVH
ncbi:hypothetical protein JVU11DRAFT_7834 [Chiua virens]|nr:hypothetical protein JVU11DRAFT_7834 [Chiua virens]